MPKREYEHHVIALIIGTSNDIGLVYTRQTQTKQRHNIIMVVGNMNVSTNVSRGLNAYKSLHRQKLQLMTVTACVLADEGR